MSATFFIAVCGDKTKVSPQGFVTAIWPSKVERHFGFGYSTSSNIRMAMEFDSFASADEAAKKAGIESYAILSTLTGHERKYSDSVIEKIQNDTAQAVIYKMLFQEALKHLETLLGSRNSFTPEFMSFVTAFMIDPRFNGDTMRSIDVQGFINAALEFTRSVKKLEEDKLITL